MTPSSPQSDTSLRLDRLLAAGLVTQIGLTWRLWVGNSTLPQIPWFAAGRSIPIWVDLVLLAMFGLCLVRHWAGRTSLASRVLQVSLWGFLLSVDQLRLQPWAWHFFLLLLMQAFGRNDDHASGWRSLCISIYLWSAVSKLDRAFVEDHGQLLLTGLLKSLGESSHFWSEQSRSFAALSLPLVEFGVALLLWIPITRTLGWLASMGMHLALLATLGPWGLNHEAGVLGWNIFFLVQNTLLFSPWGRQQPAIPRPGSSGTRSRCSIGWAVLWSVCLAFPVLESVGWFDHWPAWAVYCSRSEQVRLMVAPELASRLNDRWQSCLAPPQPFEERQALRLEQLVFDHLHVPPYPQGRYKLSLIRSLLDEHDATDGEFEIRIGQAPDRWTGVRQFDFVTTRVELNRILDDSLINTRPRTPK